MLLCVCQTIKMLAVLPDVQHNHLQHEYC